MPLSSTHIETVEINLLKYGLSPRSIEEDVDYILRLAEIEGEFPPILVHRDTMQVIDGRHRLKAALQKGKTQIEVVFFDGSEADAFIHAVAENVVHGLPLTVADRKAAASRILSSHPGLSDRAIASYTGLAAKTIAQLRKRSTEHIPQSNVRLGADRRTRPLDGSEGRVRASQMIIDRPDAPLREIARTAGVSLGTAHDVRRRIRRGENPVPDGRQRADQRAKPSRRTNAKSGNRVGEPAHPDVKPEAQAIILRKLTEDPALRHSERGRELLRLLRNRTVALEDFLHLIEAVPAHRAETIAEYARQCAQIWEMFAYRISLLGGIPETRGQDD
jgi:ParB-like chromosome segregation protein Spo0J